MEGSVLAAHQGQRQLGPEIDVKSRKPDLAAGIGKRHHDGIADLQALGIGEIPHRLQNPGRLGREDAVRSPAPI